MGRVLFITQKIDLDDDVLGVYHRWIEALANEAKRIVAVCLYRGRVKLPENVRVYSLGKEELEIGDWKSEIGKKLIYAVNFFKYIWQLRHDYDTVFVHMNPEYVILGAPFWKLWRKKIVLWYNHPFCSWKARLAIAFSNTVLHTSPFAFAARFDISRQMPVGIDTDVFRRISGIQKKKNSILCLGRISPIKNLDTLLNAVEILDEKGTEFSLDFIGNPEKIEEIEYLEKLKKQASQLVKKGKVKFSLAVPNYETPKIYNAYEILVNLTTTGSFDKTIIEAMACETLVLTSNGAISDVLPPECRFVEKDADDLANKLIQLIALPEEKKKQYAAAMRRYAATHHDLKILVKQLVEIL